jgi:hypothetical protein
MKTYVYLFIISIGFFGLTSFSAKSTHKPTITISANATNNTPVAVTVTCADITGVVLNPMAFGGGDSGSIITDPSDPLDGITVTVDFGAIQHFTYYAHIYADAVFYSTLTMDPTHPRKRTLVTTYPTSSVTVICDNIP